MIWFWILFSPIGTILVCLILSLLGIEPPKKGSGASWFPDEKEW